MKRSVIAVVSLVAVMLAASAAQADLVIDAFSDEFPPETFVTGLSGSQITAIGTSNGLEVGNLYITQSPNHDEVGETLPAVTFRNVESITQTGLAGVLGGQRTGTLTSTGVVGRQSGAYSGYGVFFQSNNASAKSNVKLEYGNVTALNADFSSLGASGYFLLGGWYLDNGTVTATLTLTSGATTQSKSITLSTAAYDSPVDYTIAFADFNLISFGDVDTIRLEFVNNATSQDTSLLTFKAVPEPTSLGLLALGGLMMLKRKRSKA